MRYIYSALLYLFLPLIFIRLIWRGFKNSAYWRRWPERFGFVRFPRSRHAIWLHAVSLGEVNAAVPLIEALLERYPDRGIIVTTMTPTGSAQVRRKFRQRVNHCYVPYDLPDAVKRFLDRANPAVAIIMETEIWPNLIATCRQKNIPVLCANVRLSESSFQGYQRVRYFIAPALEKVSAFAVQSQADADRLTVLGAKARNVHVTGSIKFEIDSLPGWQATAECLRQEWGEQRPVVIAGSTHEHEEEIILRAYDRVRHHFPDLLLVMVPRHPERFDEVTELIRRAGFNIARRTEHAGSLDSHVEVYLGDTMGELPALYASADVAVIGGSFVGVGGHNTLEASAVGVPVVFGPNMSNFLEISKLTLEKGAGWQADDENDLAAHLERLLVSIELRHRAGDAGLSLVAENRGALERTMSLFEPYLRKALLPG